MALSVVPASRSQYTTVWPLRKTGRPDEKPSISITATFGWRSDVITSRLRTAGLTTVIVARRAGRSQLLLQFGNQCQCRHRRHVIDVHGRQLPAQLVVVRRRLEQ